jgi:hypothetical protein
MSTSTFDDINLKKLRNRPGNPLACDHWIDSLYGFAAVRYGQHASFFTTGKLLLMIEPEPRIGLDDMAQTSAALEFHNPRTEAFDSRQRNKVDNIIKVLGCDFLHALDPARYNDETTTSQDEAAASQDEKTTSQDETTTSQDGTKTFQDKTTTSQDETTTSLRRDYPAREDLSRPKSPQSSRTPLLTKMNNPFRYHQSCITGVCWLYAHKSIYIVIHAFCYFYTHFITKQYNTLQHHLSVTTSVLSLQSIEILVVFI